MANLINSQQLREAYLTGVKQTDQQGNPFPNLVYDIAIQNAISWFEITTKIHTTDFVVADEIHDYHAEEYLRWSYLQVYEYPVQSVTSIQAIYPTGQTILLFPSTWIKAYPASGQIHLVPTAGTLTQVLIGQGGSYIPLLEGRFEYFPSLFHIAYTAGFTKGQIPAMVNEIIGLQAAIHVMSTAGSVVIEPGIQSKSLSVDGLSQTTSAMVGQFGPYSGRINAYQQRINSAVETITQQYKGIRMTVL
jgi:hypothetical protein